jgi:hypothetical protein
MTYTEFDIKLIRHALDTNSEGEARNAAAMFFKELRKRGIKAHEFLETGGNVAPAPASKSRESNLDYKVKYECLREELNTVSMHLSAERGGAQQYGDMYIREMVAHVATRKALAECQKELALARKRSR